MSGPIVRKYGFPNFEKIFGDRPIQHGSDEPAPAKVETATADTATKPDAGKAAKDGTKSN